MQEWKSGRNLLQFHFQFFKKEQSGLSVYFDE